MQHAKLSPSSANRWLACTPSAHLEDQMPEQTSIYADEGTLAHSIGDLMLRLELKRIAKPAYKKQLAKLQTHELYAEEMLDHCADYVSIVMEKLTEARTLAPDAIIYTEQKFNLSQYVPESFGTSDCSIIAQAKLFVVDLKYGKGVPVSSEQNRQLMLYALGVYLEFSYAYDIENISLTIVQPRIDNTSTWEISVKDLLHWADTELKEKAALAFEGLGEFVAGNHCTFCKVRATCRANYEHQMQIAVHDFAEPVLLKDEEVSDILGRVKLFEDWLTSVKEYALDQAVNHGKTWPGYKLVLGRSNRKYTDEDKIKDALLANGYKLQDIGRWNLFTITKMEKEVLGKKTFADLLASYVLKPPGKPVLAPETDKRPVFNSAEQAVKDFSDAD